MESGEDEQDLAGGPEEGQGRAGGGTTYTSCSSLPCSRVGHDEPGWVGGAGERPGLGAGPAGRSFTLLAGTMPCWPCREQRHQPSSPPAPSLCRTRRTSPRRNDSSWGDSAVLSYSARASWADVAMAMASSVACFRPGSVFADLAMAAPHHGSWPPNQKVTPSCGACGDASPKVGGRERKPTKLSKWEAAWPGRSGAGLGVAAGPHPRGAL